MQKHGLERKPKVLLIEDDPIFCELADAVLAGFCELFIATSLADADSLLSLHDDIAVVILDGHVPQDKTRRKMDSTVLLAQSLAQTRGQRVTLYAASGDPDMNAAFVRLGAKNTTKANAYMTVARDLCGRCSCEQ